MTQKQIIGWFFSALIFINTFLIIGTFRSRGFGDDTMDWQVLLKLAFWAFSFFIAMFFWRLWITKFIRYDNIFLSILLILMLISCVYSPSFNYSIGATFSVIAVLCLFFAAGHFLEDDKIVGSVFASISMISIISLIVYYVLPDMGRMKEWQGAVEVTGVRMSGIAGSPNSIGFAAAIGLMIAVYYYKSFMARSKILFLLFFVVNILCLVMSESRTSMLALILSTAIAYFAKFSKERLFLLCLCILGLTAVVLIIDLQSLMVAISRSGDSSEITTGTGRIFIWKAALRLISEKPIMGWGYASSVFIFPKLGEEIGHAPPNAHNLVLQILFSNGFIGLIVFVVMFLTKIYYSLRFGDYFKIALLTFLFINGLTEALLFRGTVSPANIIFALVVCLDYRRFHHETNHPPPQQRLS